MRVTLPDERTKSLMNAREFLIRLLDPRETPRVPLSVRREARWVLKHYPSQAEIEALADEMPELFGRR